MEILITIANMPLGDQIFLCQIVLCPIGSRSFLITPATRQGATPDTVDDIAIGRIEFLSGDMTAVDLGKDLSRDISTKMSGHLMRP
jgi:hypothetical protein